MTIGEYNRCVDDYSDGLYRFLLKNLKDEEVARDLVQESFMRLWTRRKDIDPQKSKSYLFTVGYHASIDHIRKNSRMEAFTEKHESKAVHSSYSDAGEILEKAVELLPEDQKAVLMLRDYEGYAYKEISDITGLSESQVKVYIFRARMFLKKYIVNPDYVI